MRVLILEDEDLAAWALIAKLPKVDPSIEVAATLDSVRAAAAWFRENPMPDLAFFDIQLADGLSFEIFDQVKITCPVVFTTAYDAYALRAFRVNSIDYLLKPVSEEDLARALAKWRGLRGAPAPAFDAGMWQEMLRQLRPPQYKNRFMVKIGDHLNSISAAEIDFFYGENKIVWLRHQNGRKYPVEFTLDELEDLLDPTQFFRLNRRYIAALPAIRDVTVYSNSRLKVLLKDPPDNEDVLISREKVDAFKAWFGK